MLEQKSPTKSSTSGKRPPKMSNLRGRLRELRHIGSKFCLISIVARVTYPMFLILCDNVTTPYYLSSRRLIQQQAKISNLWSKSSLCHSVLSPEKHHRL